MLIKILEKIIRYSNIVKIINIHVSFGVEYITGIKWFTKLKLTDTCIYRCIENRLIV